MSLSLLFVAHASANSKSITFRGVEWGSSPKVVKDSFFDPIRWGSQKYNSCFGMDYWIKGKGPVYSGDTCIEIESEYSYTNKINVAGKKAAMVILRFAVVPGSDEPSFIMAEYLFASGNLYDIMIDLNIKLSELYGEYEQSMEFTPNLDIYNIWRDADGNAISLYKHGDSILSLRYISSKIDELLAKANTYVESSSRYEGL